MRRLAPDPLSPVLSARIAAGLTRIALSVRAGVSPGTLYWLERHQVGSPATLAKVARALGVAPSTLSAPQPPDRAPARRTPSRRK